MDPISAVAAKGATSTSSLGFAAEVAPAWATHAQSAGFGGLTQVFQQTVQTLKAHESAGGSVVNADPVLDAKTQIEGADGAALVADTNPATGARPGAATSQLGALEKSFDHAVFVSLVSQVVSGVSQATSTLVKQA